MKRLVLVLGAGGQLGDALAAGFAGRHEVVARTRADLDITAPDAVHATVADVGPDVIVNCAAYTDVNGAEGRPVAALAANALAVRTLARAAGDADAVLVHFSTDFVFDGETDRPYDEDDRPNPRGVYAASKLLGEWFAAAAPSHYVLRVESLFGGERRKSSVDRILEGLAAGREVPVFADRVVSPSYVEDVVEATRQLVERGAPGGLYHCVNTGWATWLDLAHEAAARLGCPTTGIRPVTLASADLRPPRPRFAALSNARLAAAGIVMPTWQDALQRHIVDWPRSA